jgi:hypothetical protein
MDIDTAMSGGDDDAMSQKSDSLYLNNAPLMPTAGDDGHVGDVSMDAAFTDLCAV